MRPVFTCIAMLAAFLILGSAASACVSYRHKGALYAICAIDPSRTELRIVSADADGRPFGSFAALGKHLWMEERAVIRLAVNGGMYDTDLRPVGLLIEDGKVRRPASTKDGWGNFHLKPNGIFFIESGRAGVLETTAYLASGLSPDHATQSGPMLVIDGAIHPRFDPAGTSLKIRNGVGVDRAGRVIFAISEEPVRFHDLATLYRDILGCPNALFLDGTISSLMAPDRGRQDDAWPLGVIIAAVRRLP